MAELGPTNICASQKSAMFGYSTTCGENATTPLDLFSAGDQGLEPGVALEVPPPPGVAANRPVLGVSVRYRC
jgi:hypothetical protein